MHPMCSRTCELVESVAPYPKTSTEELNQCGCHKRCPRGVPEAKQSCLHDLFGFFYRCRCHEHVSLLNLLHRIPEELSQSGCHKRCPRGVPEASEGGVEPTGGGGRGGAPWWGTFRPICRQGSLAYFSCKTIRLPQTTSKANRPHKKVICTKP